MNAVNSFDLAVIGGGINGAGIARDAAGRGFSVLLCEQDDLAQHTSGASTKLIHGGLRYLERGELRLVRKALIEREVLLRAAPHLIRPLRFVLPIDRDGGRPGWRIRAGLFLYDHLARRDLLPASGAVRLDADPAGAPLKPEFVEGFAYWDARVDDARLVVANALDAFERGADIRTHVRCIGAERSTECWRVRLLDRLDGREREVRTRTVVNAAGPWVAQILDRTLRVASTRRIRLVKGSHVIVPELFDHESAYIFQNPDGRVTFAIPYEGEFTLIGTTDVEFSGDSDPADVRIDEAEIHYLCEMASRYFLRSITPDRVVHTYSGVRPLLDDESTRASAVTRDYRLELNRDGAPLLSVFGGKITTYRKLAEEAVDLLGSLIGTDSRCYRHWTAGAPLPGGDLPGANFDAYHRTFRRRFPWLSERLGCRLARAYGSRADSLLAGASSIRALGDEVARDLYERELIYLCDAEWARTADDILWRRTKLGLHLSDEEQRAVSDWMQRSRPGAN